MAIDEPSFLEMGRGGHEKVWSWPWTSSLFWEWEGVMIAIDLLPLLEMAEVVMIISIIAFLEQMKGVPQS